MGLQYHVRMYQGAFLSSPAWLSAHPLYDTWRSLAALVEGVPAWERWWAKQQAQGPSAVSGTLSKLAAAGPAFWEEAEAAKQGGRPLGRNPMAVAREHLERSCAADEGDDDDGSSSGGGDDGSGGAD